MNIRKLLETAGIVAMSALTLSACSSNNKANSTKIPTKISKKTTVVFWHGMHGKQLATLEDMTKDFEKKNPNINVKLEGQGSYINLQGKINATLQSPKNLPTITQAYPGWLYQASQNKMLVNLKPYMTNTSVGWGDKSNEIKPALLKGAQIDGVQYGIPFNKSIDVLVYNKDLFKKYGIKKVPTNMDELAKVSKTIYEKSNHKVVGAGFDSLANYYVLNMRDKGVNFNKDINFSGAKSKAVIDAYAKGMKDGYFRMAGSEHYLSGPFANQDIAMFIGTSAGESYVKLGTQGKFDYGVAPYPGKYTMQQGTDIYMFNQASAMQKAAAFKYMKYLTGKDNQIKWAKATGYLPVNVKALNSKDYQDSSATKLPKIINKATANVYSIPAEKNSNAAYNALNPIMQNILIAAQKHQNVNTQINQGKQKFDAAWKQ